MGTQPTLIRRHICAEVKLPMVGRTPGRTVFAESFAEVRNVVRKNNLLSTDRTALLLCILCMALGLRSTRRLMGIANC